jgi:hypothetical protein
MTHADWADPKGRLLIAVFRMAADSPAPAPAVMVILNAGPAQMADLALPRPGHSWVCRIDTSGRDPATARPVRGACPIPPEAVLALVEEPQE